MWQPQLRGHCRPAKIDLLGDEARPAMHFQWGFDTSCFCTSLPESGRTARSRIIGSRFEPVRFDLDRLAFLQSAIIAALNK